MTKLIINGLMNDEDIAWKKIPCNCDMSNPEKCHPISRNCKHCCCKQAEDSMPRESFKVNQPVLDKDGNITEEIIVKEVKEITISRSSDGYDSILGWTF
tara:strand:- start:33 stop:329 length:297 start_codon:yes stop_codon:yes gene_type:complete